MQNATSHKRLTQLEDSAAKLVIWILNRINEKIPREKLWKLFFVKSNFHEKKKPFNYWWILQFIDKINHQKSLNRDFTCLAMKTFFFSILIFQKKSWENVNENFCYRLKAIILLCLHFIDYTWKILNSIVEIWNKYTLNTVELLKTEIKWIFWYLAGKFNQ